MKSLFRLACLALALGFAACTRQPVAPEVAQALDDGRRWRDSLLTVAADSAPALDSVGLVSLGYVERARMGLGSPFRLVDFALNDPRLPRQARERTAWAVLAMLYDRTAYAVEPAALDSLFVRPAANGRGAGAAQLALIEEAVRGADDPRLGEATVRLAYSLAGAERLVQPSALTQAARAAAQLRDRELARTDLLVLLREARTRDLRPLDLVPAWRLGRRFAVESPRLGSPVAADDAAAVAAVPEVLDELRSLAASPADPTRLALADTMRRLPAAAASRLAELESVRGLPPQAPVIVPLNATRRAMLAEPGLSPQRRAARERFVERSRHEELLAAEYARLGAEPGRQPALAALWAATTLRAYAQEPVWFPGWGGPTAQELRATTGIAAVTFDAEVPEAWRPYYRRMLAIAAQDLRRVLPSLDLTGLRVHIGAEPLRRSALALHDPRSRRIYLPVGTGAGAIAHELAHDLDWQMAARLERRGDYSTDDAVRHGNGPLAATLQALSSATLVAPSPENSYRAPHAQRPTEVFASSVDWYVAAALAREGRMNGYLTSVQDELLSGYAAVSAPDVRGDAGQATVDVLSQMTHVPVETGQWFLSRYGHERTPTAYDLVRRLVEVAAPDRASELGATTELAGLNALPRCVDARLRREVESERDAAHRTVAELAAEAIARRIVNARGVPTPAGPVRVADAWERGPWAPDVLEAEVARVKGIILERAEALERPRPFERTLPRYLPDC